ncbi:MAG: FtsQ-type POTRA domain-containing protein [Pseudomonadota bacterium]
MPKLKNKGIGWLWPFSREKRGRGKRGHASLTAQLRNTAIGSGVILAVVTVIIAIKTDLPARAWHQTGEFGWSMTEQAGLRVEELVVFGLRRTAAADAKAALAIERETPILRVDVQAAHERLVSLPWIRDAKIRRQLPDQIRVEIEERNPLAIWRRGKTIGIVDTDGVPIMPVVPSGLEHLPVIAGQEANEAAPALLAILDQRPELAARIAASKRVAGRRWDLVMDNGVIVRLPTEDIDQALDELGVLMTDQAVIERNVLAIDLRQDDRLLLRIPPEVQTWLAEQKEKS